MNPHTFFLFSLSVLLLVLSLWILLRYSRTSAILSFCGFLLGLAFVAAVSAFSTIHYSDATLLGISKFGYVSTVFTATMLFIFSWHYPLVSRGVPRHLHLYWLLPLAFFTPIIIFSSEFIRSVRFTDGKLLEIIGIWYWTFPVFVIVSVGYAIRNFFLKFRVTNGIEQRNARYFLIVLIVSTVLAIIFDVVLPALGFERTYLGIESSAILFLISTYIVIKK